MMSSESQKIPIKWFFLGLENFCVSLSPWPLHQRLSTRSQLLLLEFPAISYRNGPKIDFHCSVKSGLFFILGFTPCKAETSTTRHQFTWKRRGERWKAFRKAAQKEPKFRRLSTLDLKQLRSQVKGKHSPGREFQSLVVSGKKLLTYCHIQEWRQNHASSQNNEWTCHKNEEVAGQFR